MSNDEAPTRDRLWTRPFISMLVIGFFINMSSNMFLTIIPVYARQIGGSTTVAGLTTTLVAIAALIFRPLSGNLLDSKGRKPMFIAGMVFIVAVTLGFNIALTIPVLLVLRTLYGIGFSIQSTATSTIFSDLIPSSRLGEGMGYSGIAITAAQAVGPAVGLYIVQDYGYNAFFVFSTVFVGIAAFLSLFTSFENKAKAANPNVAGMDNHPEAIEGLRSRIETAFIEKNAVVPSLVIFFITLTNAAIMTFLPMYALERGIKDIGLYFTVSASAMMFTRITTGKLFDRYGASKVVIPGMVLMISALILLSIAATLPLFILVAVIFGVGIASIQPVMIALAVKLSPASRRGAANATYFVFLDMAFAIGPVIWGALIPAVGYSNMYLVASCSIIVSFFIFTFVLNKKIAGNN